MRELLLWHVTDMNIGFARFCDTVVAQTAMVLMNRGGGKFINALDEQQHNEEPQGCEGDDPYTPEEHAAWEHELLAEFRRGKGGGKGGGRRAKGNGKGRPAANDDRRGPRHCPNCSGTHAETKCHHLEVDRKDRRCWICQKTGHSSGQFLNKKFGAALRTVADEPEGAVRRLGVVGYAGTDDGYVPARKTFKPVPRPTELKVEHFLKNNRFSGLSK